MTLDRGSSARSDLLFCQIAGIPANTAPRAWDAGVGLPPSGTKNEPNAHERTLQGMNEEDAADWQALCAGDSRGLGRLFDRHEARLFRHAARLLTTREDAKDAVAIAFFELWRRQSSVRLVDGSPLPWLLNTVSNTARNLERSARRYRTLLGRMHDPGPAEGVRPADETGVLAALRRLPVREQSVVVLTIMQGYPESETARALGIPVGTVKSRLSRAKARLRGELGQMGMAR